MNYFLVFICEDELTEYFENVHHLLEDKHSPKILLPVGIFSASLSGYTLLNASQTAANDFGTK
jgi:hypothetical protein